MARRGENIYYRKDNRWEGRYIVGRKLDGTPRFRSIYGRSYREVKKRLILLKSEHLSSGTGEPVLTHGNGSFADWMDYWLEVIEKPYIKETTYQLYQRNVENHLRPHLGCVPITQLRRSDIQNLVDILREKLASSTLHGVCRQLKNILSQAVKHHLIVISPYVDIRLPKYRQKQPRVLSAAEQTRLERAAVAGGNLEYLLCLYTGLRLGELCALRYEDIDFVSNTLMVRHSVKRIAVEGEHATELKIGAPKTENAVREIPLPFFLTKMLMNRFHETGAMQQDYIFENKKGSIPNPRTMQKRFAQLTQKAGINGAHMHTLRHTFAMRCLERGMGYKALSEILGHGSSAVTIKCYDNCTKESKEKIMRTAHMIA